MDPLFVIALQLFSATEEGQRKNYIFLFCSFYTPTHPLGTEHLFDMIPPWQGRSRFFTVHNDDDTTYRTDTMVVYDILDSPKDGYEGPGAVGQRHRNPGR